MRSQIYIYFPPKRRAIKTHFFCFLLYADLQPLIVLLIMINYESLLLAVVLLIIMIDH